MHLYLLFIILFTFLRALVIASFSCPAKETLCLESFLNNSVILNTFLGDHGTVIFQNDLVQNVTACPAMSVIFARGTAEFGECCLLLAFVLRAESSTYISLKFEPRLTSISGNVGILTGPPFFAAIAEYMNGTGRLAIQGVDYPAEVASFLAGGSPIGAALMAQLINTTLAACPSTPLVLSGYSQGAQLVHLAALSLPASTTAKISSVVLFGDPKNGTAIQGVAANKVLTICHAGDDICKGGDDISMSHLNYSLDSRTAAVFALGSAGAKLGITSQKMRPADRGLG